MYRNKLVLLFSLCLFCLSGFSQQKLYVSTIVGDTSGIYKGVDSNSGYKDGVGVFARLNGPTGLAIDTSNAVYVTDTRNNLIRRIYTKFNRIETIAGDTVDIKKGLDSNYGYLNGPAFTAKFANPFGVCVDKLMNVYIADTYNNCIRKISSSGTVTTYAGRDSITDSVAHTHMVVAGYINGPDSIAEFNFPLGVAVDTAGNLFVTDYGNNAIREISAAGMVTTLAGRGPSLSGYVNGDTSVAQFYSIYGIALDKKGAIYVSQFANGANAIRRIYNHSVTTYAGYDTAALNDSMYSVPSGYKNGKSDTAYFNAPAGIVFDTAGNLLIADEYNNVIRKIDVTDSMVTTFAGNYFNDTIQYKNSWDSLAVFYNPMGIVTDRQGNIYVADMGNNVIREINLQPITLGINSVKQLHQTLNVYPNPCIDRLNIVSSFNGKADLLDVTGRVIWSSDSFKSPYILSTSAISPGVYFLRISSQANSEIRKIEVVK